MKLKISSDTNHMASACKHKHFDRRKREHFYNSFEASWARIHHQSACLAKSNLDLKSSQRQKNVFVAN